ncbi:hypothetical protein S245_006554 [Arachis hypogaea]
MTPSPLRGFVAETAGGSFTPHVMIVGTGEALVAVELNIPDSSRGSHKVLKLSLQEQSFPSPPGRTNAVQDGVTIVTTNDISDNVIPTTTNGVSNNVIHEDLNMHSSSIEDAIDLDQTTSPANVDTN